MLRDKEIQPPPRIARSSGEGLGLRSTGFSLWGFLRSAQCNEGLRRVISFFAPTKTHRLKSVLLGASPFFGGRSFSLSRPSQQFEQHKNRA
ncbi:MAG TPA: hypothetical protein VH161_00495, partial [Candidatus Acidoferrales bacterium]|nr:hypothetical protein [Candidatus Acidoferrales bacterium]